MPCLRVGHVHTWPAQGALVLEGCEHFCAFCTGADAFKEWRPTSALRDHITRSHARPDRTHPSLTSVTISKTPVPRQQNVQQEQMQAQSSIHAQYGTFATFEARPPSSSEACAATMLSIHQKLQLRPQVVRHFHLLMWRHVLGSKIPDLENVAKAANIQSTTVPTALLNPIAYFLATYGSRLWPSSPHCRNHLTGVITQPNYWFHGAGISDDLRPTFIRDGYMSLNDQHVWATTAQFRTGYAALPSPQEILVYSNLGRLISTYIFAMLQQSLEDTSSFEMAVTQDSKKLLFDILAADEQPKAATTARRMKKPACDVEGPIGEALALEEKEPWDYAVEFEQKKRMYRQETAWKGGLP